MIDSRCHSFEAIPLRRYHDTSLTSLSRSDSSHEGVSSGLMHFASFTLPFPGSPANSQLSLSLEPETSRFQLTLSSKENEEGKYSPRERGRSRNRAPLRVKCARNSFQSPDSPDRFIPKREFGECPSTPYRVNKRPQQLSPDERLRRRRLPGDDPFLPTRRGLSGFHRQSPVSNQLLQRLSHRPHLVTDPVIRRSNDPNERLRQINSGAVRGFGGASAMVGDLSVADFSTSQGVTSRGTAAPATVARFLSRNTAVDDQNKYESRVALALDIDRTTRLLNTSASCPDVTPSPTSVHHERFSPFVWKESAWKRVERDRCKYCIL